MASRRVRMLAAGFYVVGLLATGLAGAPPAEGNTVAVRATDVQMIRDGDVLTVTGRVLVRNWGFSSVTGVAIIGPEDGPLKGQVVYVGVVPPESEVESDGAYTFTMDISATPGRNFVVPVTVQFSLDGEQHDFIGTLALTIPQ